MTSTDLTALARTLAVGRSNLVAATRPVDRKTLSSYVEGLCDAAHALGVGSTPFSVNLAVIDAVKEHGTMPAASAMNDARVAWFAAVVPPLAAALAAA